MSEKTPRKGRLEVKGPAKLPITMIKDIVNNRGIPKARQVLAKKHGISEHRVDNVWKEYYGGKLLEDYKTGLKKPLPDAETVAKGPTREVKVGSKKIIVEEPTVRAHAARKLDPSQKKIVTPTPELDIDNLDSADDTTADIISGEIQQGNDNEDLISAMYELIESNKNLSESARVNLESARDYYEKTKRKYKKLRAQSKNTKYSRSSIDESDYENDGYDSTKVGMPKPRSTPADFNEFNPERVEQDFGRISEEDPGFSDESGEISGDGGYYEAPCVYRGESEGSPELAYARQNSVRHTVKLPAVDRRDVQVPRGGHQQRAQPVYQFRNEPVEPEREERPTHSGRPYRTSAKVPIPQFNASQTRVQQDNILYNTQLSRQPGQRGSVHQASASGPTGNRPALIRPI